MDTVFYIIGNVHGYICSYDENTNLFMFTEHIKYVITFNDLFSAEKWMNDKKLLNCYVFRVMSDCIEKV